MTAALVLAGVLGTGAARAWHAEDVTVTATCDSGSATYNITATIQQSQAWPGAVVLGISPSSFPGTTKGEQTVTVKIGWPGSADTQTFTKTVTLGGDCCPPRGKLVVVKHVVNDNGGTAAAGDWTMHVSGPASFSFAGAEGGVSNVVPPGAYSVTESGGPSGYSLTYSGDCDGSGHVTVSAHAQSTCVLTNDDTPPPPPPARGQGSISVSKSADPTTLKEPGGPVTFSVTVTNTSNVPVTIDTIVDDTFGDLGDEGGNGCFDVPINLPPGGHSSCSFEETVTGAAGTTHRDVVTAKGHDEWGHTLTASDDARVDITPRLIDLVVVKDATSPTPLDGIVNYTLTVTNRGPDTATNVQLADPAPAGITYLSATASQGTCTVSPSLVGCDLGTLAAGQSATVGVSARATTVGSHTNTATVTGSGGQETNPADNVDTAVTVVPAPNKPPVPKPKPTPKPKPVPEVCLALTVTPKMITANGKPDRVVVTVVAGKKRVRGAVVLVEGAGIHARARTNGRGVAVLRLNPKKEGVITVSVAESNRKLCGPKRIGVVGVFLPPVTG